MIHLGDVEGIQSLLKSNPDIKINEPIPNQMWTPLMFACQAKKVDLVKYLLYDLKVNPNDHVELWTPLMLACRSKDVYYELPTNEADVLKIVQALLDCGAIVNIHNSMGETAFMFASENGFASVVKMLIESSVSIEAVDNTGETALFYAIKNNHYEVAKILVEAGSLNSTVDRFGNTPKLTAMQLGYDDIVGLFPADEVVPIVPSDYLSYNSYKDYLPTVFPNPDRYVDPTKFLIEIAKLLSFN